METSNISSGHEEYDTGETAIDELFMGFVGPESSVSTPEEEWSTDNLPLYSEVNVKRELYLQGLLDPGSGEVCTKYIAVSDSSILRHPYYNYPSIKDPGIVEALNSADEKKIYPMDGQDLYLDLCKEMKIGPVRMFYSGLMDDAIDLSYYGLSTKSIRAMCLALTYNQTVRRIDFTSNYLSRDSCYHLGQLLGDNHVLEEIVLNECKVGIEGLRRIVVNLHSRNTDLLDLSNNNLGDEGFHILMDTFFRGAIIKRLRVSNNKLGHISTAELIKVLECNNNFTELDLSWNQFGLVYRAADKLLNLLAESQCLVELNVAFNYFTNADVMQSLICNIQHLDLSRNKLKSNVVQFIVKGLRRSKLKSLNLARNPFTPEDAMAILKGFKRRIRAHTLNMDDIDVEADFVELATQIQAKRNVIITYGRVVREFVIHEVNIKDIIIKRFNFLCRSKSKKKRKLDFCVFLLTLERKKIPYIDIKLVVKALKEGRVIVDDGLVDELLAAFPGPLLGKGDRSIDVGAICEHIRRLFPNKQPDPPTPEPKPKSEIKLKLKKKGKEAAGKGVKKGKKK